MESFDDITIPDDGYFFRDGDGNQEDIDNESPLVWASSMPKGTLLLLLIVFWKLIR